MHLTSYWVFYHEQIVSQDIKIKMAASFQNGRHQNT